MLTLSRDLKFYKNLPYQTSLHKQGDRFVLCSPELRLIENDADLQKTYARLAEQKRKYSAEMIALGRQDKIRLSRRLAGRAYETPPQAFRALGRGANQQHDPEEIEVNCIRMKQFVRQVAPTLEELKPMLLPASALKQAAAQEKPAQKVARVQ